MEGSSGSAVTLKGCRAASQESEGKRAKASVRPLQLAGAAILILGGRCLRLAGRPPLLFSAVELSGLGCDLALGRSAQRHTLGNFRRPRLLLPLAAFLLPPPEKETPNISGGLDV